MLLTLLATAGLALYVDADSSFGSIYGPLAGVFALLLWSLLSSIALFYGTAVCAPSSRYGRVRSPRCTTTRVVRTVRSSRDSKSGSRYIV